MSRITRRDLLGSAAGAAAASALPFRPVFAADAPPSDTIRIAVCGVKGRGGNHVQEWLKMNDVEIAGICDVDTAVTGNVMKSIEKKQGKAPRFEQDWRKLMEDKSIDAVSIATCNHTHTLLSIWALQAGKHVYVEKPLSHNVWEGRQLVKAARKFKKCVQQGSQSRSSGGCFKLATFLAAGKMGKIPVSRGLCYKRRTSIGTKPDGTPPPTVNYDLWLGPAPTRPFNPNRFHYNWHWNWDYGCGDIGNQGIHEMDKARWYLGKAVHPRTVVSLGGRFGYEDDGQTPNTQIACLDYADGTQIIFEVRGLDTDAYLGEKIGNVCHCEKGHTSGTSAFDAGGKKIPVEAEGEPHPGGHFRNFINAVKADDPSLLNADVLEGHLSCVLFHIANISYRLGEEVPFDATKTPFGKNDAGNETFDRMCAHLKENNVDLSKTKYRMGPVLAFDPDTETFVGNAAADKLLTREYRPPFVVPAIS